MTLSRPSSLPLGALALTLTLLSGAARAQLGVTAVVPARNATDAPTATTIAVTFNAAVDPNTVSAKTFQVFGRWSGMVRGTFEFAANNTVVRFVPARAMFAGESVSVAVSAAVAGPSGGSLGRGYGWSFWTRPAAGSGNFALAATLPVRRAGERGIATYGAYAGDLDGDGAPDLSLPNEDASDVRVMANDGCGNFAAPVVHVLPPNGKPSTNEGQDFNGDGLTDLAVGNISGNAISVLLGDGAGGYLPAVNYPSGSGTRGLTVLDADGDFDVDVVTANRVSSNLALHRNAGDGTFLPATFFDGGGTSETGVAAADANHDGIADLFVANYGSDTVTLLLGDGAGGFSLSATAAADGSPWMIVTGDVDRDGNVDAVTCNSRRPRVSVFRGDGTGGFLTPAHYAVGNMPIAIDLGDLDGDRDLDMVASSFSSSDFTVLWNDGSGRFGSPVRLPAPAAGSCALCVDYDRDGDVDIVAIDEVDDVVLLFRQTGPAPVGVQPATCAATLRVDNLGNRGGYGGQSSHAVPAAGRVFLGVTAAPNSTYVIAVGNALEPGTPIFLGLMNLALAPIFFLPTHATDAKGEGVQTIALPPGLAPGAAFGLQGVVLDPLRPAGGLLTNPERLVVV